MAICEPLLGVVVDSLGVAFHPPYFASWPCDCWALRMSNSCSMRSGFMPLNVADQEARHDVRRLVEDLAAFLDSAGHDLTSALR